ncbi:MAG TPA: sigma-70 family RNA polymerase sigma factor [Candidatus Dormibacteraeota bacterium]|jgi:RNA polymerase sigma factor (sigma-70 family)|nr:sigma-70 family RNA polymerase sigma factor [Candidatus Dormibacteraeota bacterium]
MNPVVTDTEKSAVRGIPDTTLVKRCLSGQEEAWSQLIDKYKALIYSIPVKYGLPPQEAADVFQGTCMELLMHLRDLREPRALPKWIIQVAHHKCYHWKRQQQRLVSRDAEEELPEPEVPAVAEEFVRQAEEEQMLREAMANLAPRCRKLVEMLFFESPSRPYAEVASELNLAVGSIGLTRQKCIENLRKQLDELGFS